MEINNKNFIEKVNKSDMTLKEISEKTGISTSTLSALYNNKKDMNDRKISVAYNLAQLFNCKIEDLYNKPIE